MGAEDGNLLNTDSTGGAVMPLDYIAYAISNDGGSISEIPSGEDNYVDLTQITSPSPAYILQYNGTDSNAGSASVNSFTISWECGTGNTTGGALLGSNLTGGRYATNVFFILERDPN